MTMLTMITPRRAALRHRGTIRLNTLSTHTAAASSGEQLNKLLIKEISTLHG